ncbi:UDP-N-acetylmuramoyl-L-alanine--D-glutamate ligase [Paenisporosarcina cavernae]|uniref:UDP-N-acetylmuramoylalanine--D-glutamate ligase n=1 Tax=Paenisporosarcina cavernae TaxID=2320858 RepID=A0A385YRP2_9BACL|nr:UDP-N-acetylmuramoyl-L-alanine--D-glutamate ligase [Paenisporosarcina cavernae]AYC29161.1 UDP-N-acetylmuramoyl-L-alanine--D-glutamate ligase [Paenisporosarcina cavernae]
MKHVAELEGKKVLVLGLAKSGVAAAEILHELGAYVTVNDAKPFEENIEARKLLEKGITVICGHHPADLLDNGFQLVVKNPGIPYQNTIIQQAISREIPIWTEIELAFRISEANFIGITGSNGKTTTTTLLFHILNQANKHPLIAGNIGTVASSVAKDASKENVIVTELSSFQLMGIETFAPKIAIWTNIYEAHLDYHQSMEEYVEAKFAVTRNQIETDYVIYNADQETIVTKINQSKAIPVPFSLKNEQPNGIWADEENVYWKNEFFMERSKIALPGDHNMENVLSAIAAAMLLECEEEKIKHVLGSFTGVKHRTQFVREWRKRRIYNDSKATNTLATRSALRAFHRPTILIAGGLDRQHSFDELTDSLQHVKALLCFGETKERLADFGKLHQIPTVKMVENVQEAVKEAAAMSTEEDVILLSPACASWDQYPNFELRGDDFIDAVMKLSDEEAIEGM